MNPLLGILSGIAAVTIFVLALRAQRRHLARAGVRRVDGTDVVSFAITPITPLDTESRSWLARHGPAEQVAELEIHLRVAEPSGDSPFAPGSVVFRRVAGANGTALLRELARALGVATIPSSGIPADELTCQVSFMGSRLTRGSGPDVIAGSFTSNPPGTWIVGKVFFADGEGEVFLAVNPSEGRGEFLAKDPEFSEPVVRELARLFG